MFLVGDGAFAGDELCAGLAAVAGVVCPPACNDLMYAISCTNWSSLTWP